MEESERRYQELIQTSPAPINLFNTSGEIIWGNDAVLALLGIDSQQELIGRSIFEFVHSDDQYTAESELMEVINEKQSSGPTLMRLTPVEGQDRTIRVATAPGQYQGDDIGQAVVIDITELNQTRAELKQEREFIETALNTIEDVFYVIDTAGNLEQWNDALIEVSGYTPEEVQTIDVEDFFIEEHTDRVSESISRAFVDGSDTIEALVQTKSGEQIPYEFRKQRLVKGYSVMGLVGIGRNISQQKSWEQHLKAVDHLLQHQFRNQLNIIRGNVDLLAAQSADADGQQITAIHESVDKMLSIFNGHKNITTQILRKDNRKQMDIVAIIDELLAEFQERYPHAELSLSSPDSVLVIAVPYIEQALHELIWNALKHNTAESPEVTITIDAETTPRKIYLTDNGPLISRHEYAFIENPETLDSTSHPTGLGLWAANIAVMSSRGSFTIEESTKNGNKIIIELPAPVNSWKE
ncbi:PAS domain-containing protein [Natronosalvus rutilus]|uniref:histidine kinase n=1 Tax=Natronosalvus rutilus TaxID=2953753 RepID=A0A9E7ST87_9EURY|nr:PAS domain-containing sensor histidine kinase [Natronosalvus rutilus]UTF52285.1 PAS domain-containing sensor histidine kinase [Natronosalvus rutilus]